MAFTNQTGRPYQRLTARFAEGERRAITAKFAGTCRSCRRPTAEGDTVYWASGAGAICQDCQDGKPVQTALPVDAPAPARMAVEDAGVYLLLDGTIVKVQANKEKTRTYAKRFVEIHGERATEAGTRAHGEYRYEAGLIEQVAREGRKMSLEEAKAFILRYGFCVRCGRHLKAAESVERGIGPVCITYFEGAVPPAPEPTPAEEEAEAYQRADYEAEAPLDDAVAAREARPRRSDYAPGDPDTRHYTCTKTGCANRGAIWTGPTPAASRLATGRGILCSVCGSTAWLRPAPSHAA